MRFQGCRVVVKFSERKDIGFFQTAADAESPASWLLGAGILGLFGDVTDELVHAVRMDFEGNEQGDHEGVIERGQEKNLGRYAGIGKASGCPDK